MKTYQLTLSVPDDFNPNIMECSMNYPDGDIQLIGEGFYDIVEVAKEQVKKLSVSPINVTKTSVVIFKFPQSLAVEAGAQFIKQIQLELEANLHCTVLGLVDDIDLLVQNSAEAVKLLEGMLAKVKSKSIIKLV